jgi:hypothetical protein
VTNRLNKPLYKYLLFQASFTGHKQTNKNMQMAEIPWGVFEALPA